MSRRSARARTPTQIRFAFFVSAFLRSSQKIHRNILPWIKTRTWLKWNRKKLQLLLLLLLGRVGDESSVPPRRRTNDAVDENAKTASTLSERSVRASVKYAPLACVWRCTFKAVNAANDSLRGRARHVWQSVAIHIRGFVVLPTPLPTLVLFKAHTFLPPLARRYSFHFVSNVGTLPVRERHRQHTYFVYVAYLHGANGFENGWMRAVHFMVGFQLKKRIV